MAIGQTLEKRIQYRIKRKKDSVFMLSDFLDLSDKDQIGRALRKLIKKILLLKLGKAYMLVQKSQKQQIIQFLKRISGQLL